MKALLAVLALFASAAFSSAELSENEIDVVTEVVCPGKFSIRYEHPVTLSFDSKATASLRDALQKGINEFNETVAGLPVSIAVVKDDDSKADIIVHADETTPSVRVGVKVNSSHSGIRNSEITPPSASKYFSGVLPIAFEFDVAHLLLEAMGCVNYNSLGATSPYWHLAKPTDEPVSQPVTDFEKKTVRLLYENLPSGTPVTKVKQVVAKEFSTKK